MLVQDLHRHCQNRNKNEQMHGTDEIHEKPCGKCYLNLYFPSVKNHSQLGRFLRTGEKWRNSWSNWEKIIFSMLFAHVNTFTFLPQLNLRQKIMDYIRYSGFSLILLVVILVVLSNNMQRYFLWEDIKLSLKYTHQLMELMISEVKVQPKDKDHWCLWITDISRNSLIVSA